MLSQRVIADFSSFSSSSLDRDQIFQNMNTHGSVQKKLFVQSFFVFALSASAVI